MTELPTFTKSRWQREVRHDPTPSASRAPPARARHRTGGVAEQSVTHANAKVRAAVLHDVCEVHGNEKRDQFDAEDRAAYASILKELQRSIDAKDDPELATQTFCNFGRGLQKP